MTPGWAQLRAAQPDAIYLINYADGLTQLNGVDPHRVCVETHDLLFRSYGLDRGEPMWAAPVTRKLRKELSLLDACALVVAIANDERVLLECCCVAPRYATRRRT